MIQTNPPGTARTDRYQQARFDDPNGWTRSHHDRFEQRYQIDPQGLIYCETRTTVQAPEAQVLQKLEGPWTWYGGRYRNRQELPDGRVRYDLWPVGVGLHVQETMSPPEALPDGGHRLPIQLEQDARGLAYIDVHPQPDGTTEVVGRFAGVEDHSPFSPEHFTQNHLAVERGGFIPFYHGGFAGLQRDLE